MAVRAGVSRQWRSGLEGGKAGAEIGLVLRVIDVLNLRMELRSEDALVVETGRRPVDLDALLDEYSGGVGG